MGPRLEMLAPDDDRGDLAFAHLPEATVLVDEDGRLSRVNGAAGELLGPSAAEAADRRAPVESAIPWLAPAVARVLSGAHEAGFEAEVATAAGQRCLAARLRSLRGRAGEPRGAVAVLEDLTERRAAEARLRASERLAALGSLAAGLAHDVNNPLACVVAALAFIEAEHARLAPALGRGELGPADEALAEARDAALRVGRLVKSLQTLGFSSLAAPSGVPLAAALRGAVALAEPQLEGVEVELEADRSAVRVRGTEPLVTELFVALVLHVARGSVGEAAPERVRVTPGADGGQARVTVRGAGTRRGPRRRWRGRDESGAPGPVAIGMSVAHGIAAALGATLAFESGPELDPAATVALPLCADGC